jgi:hypothetical protein
MVERGLGAALLALSLLTSCGGTTVHEPVRVAPVAAPNGTSASAAAATGGVLCDRVIDDFSSSAVGEFPAGWRTREEDEMPFATERRIFVVEQEEERRVVHARYSERALTIGRPVQDWDLSDYPYLQWQWKAVTLPERGAETEGDRNDSAAAVYAIWHLGFPMMVRGIKYSWSSTLPIGTHASKRLGYDQLLIVETGRKHVGTWQTVRVNVRDHAASFFGANVGAPDLIAVFSDADDTESSAEAYFADFRLCRPGPSAARAPGH